MYHLLSFIIIYHYLRPSSTVFFSIIIHTYYIYIYILILLLLSLLLLLLLINYYDMCSIYIAWIHHLRLVLCKALHNVQEAIKGRLWESRLLRNQQLPGKRLWRSRGYAPWLVSPKERTRSPVVKRWNGETVKRNKACLKSKSRRGPHHSCSRCASPYQSLVKFSADWQRSNPGLHKNPCGLVQ